ncbi:Probable phytoene synthase-related protein [Laribacter hongkongensis HLHK9]|uniref:Probable phytoene synthase-related protein n=1 Tax=Laribacter hongkongensis (strain HLHK9) TaxID=557598 RepID=C1D988_LARHH|nr:Probable phytoene synthase-related protein [Laribacter hongkongensis HLHK9]
MTFIHFGYNLPPFCIFKSEPVLSVDHYENFPVGSWLLPKRVRHATHVIYRFARSADDIADEGDELPETRLLRLREYRTQLDCLAAGQVPDMPLFRDLARVVEQHRLPLEPFYHLLDAFEQDVTVTRYATFGDVVSYCRLSANPVGRLMLHLFGVTDRQSMAMSDGICTALQLVNFLQDVAVDWQKGRVYLPQSALAQYGLTEDAIARGDTGGLWGVMMRDQVRRARQFLAAGAPLGKRLPGRFGLELRLIILGGERILQKIHASNGDVFRQRPVLRPSDWLYMLWRAVRAR